MKFFTNAMIYRLNREVAFDADELNRQLESFAFAPCGSQDMAKAGWVTPMGKHSDQLVHDNGGQMLLKIMREEKILPSSVLKDELGERVEKLEAEQQRKLKKTERDSLKDEVLHSLLPRAFSRYPTVSIWIDTNTGLIFVDASSAKKAEDSLALLRKSIGSLPVVPLTLEDPIELTLTEWVRDGDLPAGFALGDSATLKAVLEDGGAIKAKNQDLVCDEISNHLEAGKVVTELSMQWQERILFTIDDNCTIKRIKFTDTLLEQNDDIDRADVAQRFDADWILMTGELSALISQLVVALGGEACR